MAPGGSIPTRLYTRTGDAGETGLAGGGRVAKDDPRIRAFGAFDELGAVLGTARTASEGLPDPVPTILDRLQHELFLAQTELSASPTGPGPAARIEERHVTRLERELDELSARLPALTTFVLARGAGGGAAIHVARTVARRAERELWTLHRVAPQRPPLLHWANRLSDLLFALALTANHARGIAEVAPDYTV